jgi:hypothetical protein
MPANPYIAVIAVFIPIALAYLLKKIGYINENAGQPIRTFVIRVTVPALIALSMIETDFENLRYLLPVSLAFVLLTILMTAAGFALFFWMKDREKRTSFIWMIGFGNYAWMGWAVLYHVLGQEGFERGIFFTTLWWPVFLAGSYIIAVLNKAKSEKRINLSDFYISIFVPLGALIIGVLINILGISLPKVALDALDSFGSMTVPLILFTVGLSISIRASIEHLKYVLPAAIVRPFLGMGLAFIVVFILQIKDPLSRNAVMIESMMPTASLLMLLADIYGFDKRFIASLIVTSTLLSIGIIPLAAYLFGG